MTFTFTTTARQDLALERVLRQVNAKRDEPYADVTAMLRAEFVAQVTSAELNLLQALRPVVADAFVTADASVQAQALALLGVDA